jgi:aspartate aminotransferase
MVARLNEMKNVECQMPKGAFYAFPRIQFTGLSSMEFSDRLLREALTAVVPGIAFGRDENIRLSYAASLQEIEKGMDRIQKFCSKL